MNAAIAILLLLPTLTISGVPWQISAFIARHIFIGMMVVGVIHFFQSHVVVYQP